MRYASRPLCGVVNLVQRLYYYLHLFVFRYGVSFVFC